MWLSRYLELMFLIVSFGEVFLDAGMSGMVREMSVSFKNMRCVDLRLRLRLQTARDLVAVYLCFYYYVFGLASKLPSLFLNRKKFY